MSENESKGGKATNALDVSLTVHELLRYGYTGVLALVAINHWGGNSIPTSAEFQNLSAWGIAGALALAVPIGALVYLVSRTIIVTPISRFWESVFSVTPATEDERRTLSFLRGCGLSIKRCLHWIMDGIGLSHAQTRYQFFRDRCGFDHSESELAFFILRESRVKSGSDEGPVRLWPDRVQQQFYRQHSETQLLHATSFLLGITGFVDLCRLRPLPALSWIALAAFLFFVAGLADLLISQRECTQIKNAAVELARSDTPDVTVETILKNHGLPSKG